MTRSQSPGAVASPVPFRPLTREENQRAVDAIERAERQRPYCLCGAGMVAVAQGADIWLECSSLGQEKHGLAGLLAPITSRVGHDRKVILELPTLN
jgi:hypothetical protein